MFDGDLYCFWLVIVVKVVLLFVFANDSILFLACYHVYLWMIVLWMTFYFSCAIVHKYEWFHFIFGFPLFVFANDCIYFIFGVLWFVFVNNSTWDHIFISNVL
jgi:hypothetical protein